MASLARANIAARREEGLEPHWQDLAAAENHERAAVWLRELRARRIADGREPDDEVNAPADMCCCSASVSRQMRCGPVSHGCPLHPRHRDCGGEPAAEECRYLGGECEPGCPVSRHDVPKD